MDHGERIAKVEATMEAHNAQFERIVQSIGRLEDSTDRGFRELRDHTDRGFVELRSHIDRGLGDQRDHTDRSIAALRDHTDRGFADMRSEFSKTNRWMIGILVTYGMAIVGIIAKSAWGS
jgi:hypothetical protein